MKTKNGKQFEILVNATALAGGEWEMIAPYGDFPSTDRKRMQRFGVKQAEEMVTTFNSIWHKVGSLFRGVPIYHGHPDVDPKNWPDDRRLGKITALEVREDGLYGKPEYNALGEENKREGWWVYPSPTWLSPRTTSNVVEPDELMSIGLVNRPNIFESQPWTNAENLKPETLSLNEEEEPETNEETDTIMKEKACALLGLDPAKATDEEISTGLDNLKKTMDEANAAKPNEEEEAAKTVDFEAERKRLEKEAADAKTATANARNDAATIAVEAAIARGAITEADREVTFNSFVADGADLPKLAKTLLDKKPEMNTASLEIGGRKVAISNARERSAAIQEEVSKRMESNGGNYDAAFKSVKKDPKFAQLFEAMKKPGEEA